MLRSANHANAPCQHHNTEREAIVSSDRVTKEGRLSSPERMTNRAVGVRYRRPHASELSSQVSVSERSRLSATCMGALLAVLLVAFSTAAAATEVEAESACRSCPRPRRRCLPFNRFTRAACPKAGICCSFPRPGDCSRHQIRTYLAGSRWYTLNGQGRDISQLRFPGLPLKTGGCRGVCRQSHCATDPP